MVWLNVLLVVIQATCWVVAVIGPNTCSRQETYVVTMRILEKKPVTTKTYTWCFQMPPRCTKYKQELVDHYRIQSETRTRWVNECCPGYRPDSADVYCEPVCPLGCQHGTCTAPHSCSCHPGYFGLSCNKAECPEGRWGAACQRMCSCLNSASCDSQTGHCLCAPGYWGNRCESTCPTGTYGNRCENRCSCEYPASTCHHISGSCDISSSCNGSSACQTAWTPTQPEVIQQLLDKASTPDDRPVPEPLVTTGEDVRPSGTVVREKVASNGSQELDTSILENDPIVSNSDLRNTSVEGEIDDSTTITIETSSRAYPSHFNTDTPTTHYTTAGDDERITEETQAMRFTGEESHEDQLEHGRSDQVTERTSEDIQPTQEVAEDSETFTEQSENGAAVESKAFQEDITEDANLDGEGQNSEISEVSTQGPYQQVERVAEITDSETKTDEQRKKFTDQKKYRSKERFKDITNPKPDAVSQKPMEMDHDWVIPEQEHEESRKHYAQLQEGSHREHMEKTVVTGKPKKVSDQKRVKDVADMGQLKTAANQERQLGNSKNSYGDFLSSFSIAAGVSTGIIMVAGLITLMARCRRSKSKKEAAPAMEMQAANNKQEDVRAPVAAEENTIPVVRPLFFSPVYLPGDVSPTEGNGGLILTAVFSRPAANLHDLYRQQDLLRETLTPHYDIPPPTGTRNSICTSIGTSETEHVYEELPCWRNQPDSTQTESLC